MNENNPFAPAEALKTVFIAYNQAYHELILRLLSRQGLRGYTSWERAEGRGPTSTMNSAMLVVAPATRVPELLKALKALDDATPDQGLRAFVWSVEATI